MVSASGPATGFSASAACAERLDVGDAMRVQRGGGGNNDGDRNQIGKSHADQRVETDAAEFGIGRGGVLF